MFVFVLNGKVSFYSSLLEKESYSSFLSLTSHSLQFQARLLLIFFILQSSFWKLFDMRIRFSNNIFFFQIAILEILF